MTTPELELAPGQQVIISASEPVDVIAPITLLKSANPKALYAVRDERERGFAWWANGQLNGVTLTKPPGFVFDVFGQRGPWLIAFVSPSGMELLTKGFWLVDKKE